MTEEVKVENWNFEIKNIHQVYSGKVSACMCGCAGTYNETEKAVKRMFNKIKKAFDNGDVVMHNDSIFGPYVFIESDTRINCIYFKKIKEN